MKAAPRGLSDTIHRETQRKLLLTLLLVLAGYSGLIGVVNFFILQSPLVALFDLTTFAAACAILSYQRVTGSIRRAGWATIITLSAILLGYVIAARGADYAVLWLTVPPPLAFYLLGARQGAAVAAVFSLLALTWLAVVFRDLPAQPLGPLALLNGAEVLLAHWLVFRFSERSRDQVYARLRELSQVDSLTGLMNRAQFEDELRRALSLAQRAETPTALLFLDLDHFKAVNDVHGHAVGDDVLVSVADILSDAVRSSDRVARWGGEEFLVLCPNTDARGAGEVAEKIRRAVEVARHAEDLSITVSLGVAVTAAGRETAEALVERADDALYRAKEAGRNRVVVHTASG